MHAYLLTRGIKNEVDKYINDLQAQHFPFPNGPIDPATGQQINIVQLSVRPIQFWELVFPKESLQPVLATASNCPHTFSEWEKFLLRRLRALLKAKEVPEFDENNPMRRLVRKQYVEATLLGVKDDLTHPKGHEML